MINFRPFIYTILILLALPICLSGQESKEQWIEEVFSGASGNFDKALASASIGESSRDQGIWHLPPAEYYASELVAFDGIPVDAAVELIWTTANEFNTDYFAIERMQADQRFAIIHIEQATKQSDRLTTYRVLDDRAKEGSNHYRLKQFDQNGRWVQSQVIAVDYYANGSVQLSAAKDDSYLNLQTNFEMVKISIVDESGQVLLETEKAEDTYSRIDIGKLKPGNYAIRVEGSDKEVRVMTFKKKL